MTGNGACLAALMLGYLWLFTWAFRRLPGEQWQFLGAVPSRKEYDGTWAGINFTYYGVWTATGVTVGVTIWLVLVHSLGIGPFAAAMLAAGLLGATVPAAKGLAAWIERKPHTFTIAGAVSVGFLVASALMIVLSTFQPQLLGEALPLVPMLAALSIAYAIGEGTGRLACISFGCCYGRPVHDLPQSVACVFRRLHFVFYGATKKAAYEGGLESAPLVPIQGITAVLSAGAGLAGLALFARGAFTAAFLTAVLGTQLWRALSELLRADYRGGRLVSSYQIMAVFNAVYALGIVLLAPQPARTEVDLLDGLQALWNQAVLLGVQLCWILIFFYTGRSRVTAASMSFSVMRDRI